MLAKIISGKNRKTRLHDEKNNFVGWRNLIRHCPRAIGSGLLRITLDHRPELPWISYEAIHLLDKFLSPTSRVLEFGSGMSTIWYAKRKAEIYSVEGCRPWHEKISLIIKARGLSNVHYHFANSPDEYHSFMNDDTEGFDLIMVDGEYRSACIANSMKLLKPGGILYLDNSDKHSTLQGGDTRLAEEYALSFAQDKGATITYITDFAPTQFFINQALLIKLPS